MKKISIVTISFNQKDYIAKCIESVLNQKYENLEYIIVDAGSKDGSRELINSYGDQIIKIFEPDNGPADGLNKGFSKASGEIFYFLNADDFLLNGALEIVNKEFSNFPTIDVICGSGFIVDSKENFIKRCYNTKFTPWLCLNGGLQLFQQGIFFKSSAYRKSNGFNPHNFTCWDGEFFLSLSLLGSKFKTLSFDLAAFRVHNKSITGMKKNSLKYKEDKERIYFQTCGNSPSRIKKLIAKFIYLLFFHRFYLSKKL